MISVTFRAQDFADKEKPLFPEFKDQISAEQGSIAGIGLLEKGMESGKPSICFFIKHNGLIIPVQTSAAMMLTLSAGMKGTMERWGQPWDGA